MKTVGILGTGQLGRMLALAGRPLGLRFSFYGPDDSTPVEDLGKVTVGTWEDTAKLQNWARNLDVVTSEFESVADAALAAVEAKLQPNPVAFQTCRHRVREKSLFDRLEVPTAQWTVIEAARKVQESDLPTKPLILKTSTLGYDGKGQFRWSNQPVSAVQDWKADREVIAESMIDFEREISLICCRSKVGDMAFWAPTENRHQEGILEESLAPAPNVTPEELKSLQTYVRSLAEDMGYVGTFAVEFMQGRDGRFYANETAPRVHNSGHWTQQGAVTCQFENHLRAILGLPLGATDLIRPTRMLNLLGTVDDLEKLLTNPEAQLHLYDKSPRPGRKLGHLNSPI